MREVSPPAYAACLLIRAYQLTLSPLLGRCCRFEPSCSRYAMEAIRRHGFLRGSALAAWRLLRCNPFCHGGYDPVPAELPPRCGAAGGRSGDRTVPSLKTDRS